MKIRIYTMRDCPFCDRAKALLHQRGVAFQEILLEIDDDKAWDALTQLSKMKTVPVIYSDERLIGGYSHLAALDKEDRLESLKNASRSKN